MPAAKYTTDELIILVSNLNPEKTDKVFSLLPLLNELFGMQGPPYPQEPFLQTG